MPCGSPRDILAAIGGDERRQVRDWWILGISEVTNILEIERKRDLRDLGTPGGGALSI